MGPGSGLWSSGVDGLDLRISAAGHNTDVATLLDWREPVQLLRLRIAPTSRRLHELADLLGAEVNADDPELVSAGKLDAHVQQRIWGESKSRANAPATDGQVTHLRSLKPDADGLTLTLAEASAWIEVELARRTIAAHESLMLRSGDAVMVETTHVDTTTGEVTDIEWGPHVVSSIGRNGMVYFKGANGRCGWPSNQRRVD